MSKSAGQKRRKREENPEQLKLDRKALQLRLMGLDYRAVGQETGVNWSTACRRAHRALARQVREAAETPCAVLNMELAKLGMVEQTLIQQVLKGEQTAIRTWLAILDRRRKIMGIAPLAKLVNQEQGEDLDGPRSIEMSVLDAAGQEMYRLLDGKVSEEEVASGE